MKWQDAVIDAITRVSEHHKTNKITRKDLIREELSQIIEDTQSYGKTPEQTLSRVLQDLRKRGLIHFYGGGVYLSLVNGKEDIIVNFRGRKVNKKSLLDVMRRFDETYNDSNDYNDWLENDRYKYILKHKDKLYPPKYILGQAIDKSLDDFSGGETAANEVFKNLGFTIIDKAEITKVREMKKVDKLIPGRIIINNDLINIFKCAPRGGMRRSHETNSLILISDHTRGVYEDKWIDGKLYYTGEGLKGDQSLGLRQNRTLAESESNNVELHLFEVFESGQYLYHGRVRLAESPRQEEQPDINDNIREVWVFPLALVGLKEPASIPERAYRKHRERKEQDAKRLTDEELDKRLKNIPQQAARRKVTSDQYQGNSEIKEKAKRLAQGKCDLCGNDAPFKDRYNKPYLEGHHIVWLSENGPDTLDNVVALCPNCHRKMHVLNSENDKNSLKKKIKARTLA